MVDLQPTDQNPQPNPQTPVETSPRHSRTFLFILAAIIAVVVASGGYFFVSSSRGSPTSQVLGLEKQEVVARTVSWTPQPDENTNAVYQLKRLAADMPTLQQAVGTTYFKDKNKVYAWDVGTTSEIKSVEGADPTTFAAYEGVITCYAKDKNYVYTCYPNNKKVTVIPNADPQTFTELETQMDMSPGHPVSITTYAKDKNSVYFLGVSLAGADAVTFEVVSPSASSCIDAKDKNHQYSRGRIVINPTDCSAALPLPNAQVQKYLEEVQYFFTTDLKTAKTSLQPFPIGACVKKEGTLYGEFYAQAFNTIISATGGDASLATCTSTASTFAVSVPLLDAGYSWCIDSAGHSVKIQGKISSDACVPASSTGGAVAAPLSETFIEMNIMEAKQFVLAEYAQRINSKPFALGVCAKTPGTVFGDDTVFHYIELASGGDISKAMCASSATGIAISVPSSASGDIVCIDDTSVKPQHISKPITGTSCH